MVRIDDYVCKKKLFPSGLRILLTVEATNIRPARELQAGPQAQPCIAVRGHEPSSTASNP